MILKRYRNLWSTRSTTSNKASTSSSSLATRASWTRPWTKGRSQTPKRASKLRARPSTIIVELLGANCRCSCSMKRVQSIKMKEWIQIHQNKTNNCSECKMILTWSPASSRGSHATRRRISKSYLRLTPTSLIKAIWATINRFTSESSSKTIWRTWTRGNSRTNLRNKR